MTQTARPPGDRGLRRRAAAMGAPGCPLIRTCHVGRSIPFLNFLCKIANRPCPSPDPAGGVRRPRTHADHAPGHMRPADSTRPGCLDRTGAARTRPRAAPFTPFRDHHTTRPGGDRPSRSVSGILASGNLHSAYPTKSPHSTDLHMRTPPARLWRGVPHSASAPQALPRNDAVQRVKKSPTPRARACTVRASWDSSALVGREFDWLRPPAPCFDPSHRRSREGSGNGARRLRSRPSSVPRGGRSPL